MLTKKLNATDIDSTFVSLIASCTANKVKRHLRLLVETNIFTEKISYRIEIAPYGQRTFLSLSLAMKMYNDAIDMTAEELRTFMDNE